LSENLVQGTSIQNTNITANIKRKTFSCNTWCNCLRSALHDARRP